MRNDCWSSNNLLIKDVYYHGWRDQSFHHHRLLTSTRFGMPIEGLGHYSDFRRVMLRNGFVPVPQAMHVDEYVEISCGNTMCTADWLGPDRRKLSFGIWFGYKGDKQIFYLAPQTD